MIYRRLGRTGETVSAIGLGGFHLGIPKDPGDAVRIVRSAIDRGITFLDNSWDYNLGESERRMGSALREGYRQRVFLMTKFDGRTRKATAEQIDESLRRLQTDHVDLIQFHENIRLEDPDRFFSSGGALEAVLDAKKAGKIRFIGFTGHKDPEIHLKMLAHNFPFDTVQMPLNCCDATFRSFETQVLPEATRKGIAALGMKSLGGSGELVRHGVVTPEQGLRYAMSLPVATTISGVDTMQVLDQNLKVAINFQPLASNEMQSLREQCRFLASDGRYELFKVTTKYDGKVGREQHHFPTVEELPI